MATALGCSNCDISKTKAVISAQSVTKESFVYSSPLFFEDRFGDNRIPLKQHFHQPDIHKLAKCKPWTDYLTSAYSPKESTYRYSRFCEHFRDYAIATGLSGVIEHEPGQELYVDSAGDKISIMGLASRLVRLIASLFVTVCPYSGLLFVRAAANEKSLPGLIVLFRL